MSVMNAAPKIFDAVITQRQVEDLKPNPRNARTHSSKQIQKLAASIKEFGFIVPVFVDGQGTILAGHARVEAAKQLRMDRVPTIRVDHLNEVQKRAYVLADNRLAELAGWDKEILAIELQDLTEIDLGFEVEITGFDTVDFCHEFPKDGAGNYFCGSGNIF